jgi:hypothetical protein
MRRGEHGGVPWYLVFTLVAAGGVGTGTYVVMHKREVEKRRLAAIEAVKPKPPKPAPDVFFGAPDVPPTLDGAAVEIAIGTRAEELRDCFRATDAKGTMQVAFYVDARGAANAIIASGPFRAEINSCVTELVRGVTFPEPTDGSSANITFLLRRR